MEPYLSDPPSCIVERLHTVRPCVPVLPFLRGSVHDIRPGKVSGPYGSGCQEGTQERIHVVYNRLPAYSISVLPGASQSGYDCMAELAGMGRKSAPHGHSSAYFIVLYTGFCARSVASDDKEDSHSGRSAVRPAPGPAAYIRRSGRRILAGR